MGKMMKIFLRTVFAIANVAILCAFYAAPAQAQATRTWVSGVGDDVNPCSRTAPCKTYAGAISKTAVNGEINCLDPGGFGTVTITKSISIVCDYTEGGVLAAGVSGFIVNAPAGSNITLKGQDIECNGTGIQGINILGVGVSVHIHKTQIRNCRGGNGILVAPSSGLAKVFVADSYITDNGAGVANAGILIKPTGGASANVSVNRVQLENNTNGVFMDGSGGGGASNLNVRDSLLSGSTFNGIAVSSTGGGFVALVESSIMNLNAGVGAAVAGASATLRIGSSTIASNVTGVSNSGGTLQSFKNNQIAGNGSDGTPIVAFPGPGGLQLQ
jgi:hypothetical protein